MPRKASYGPKYTGILIAPVEKWDPPLFALNTKEKIRAWRNGEIDRVISELQKRHEALFAFHGIEKDDPDALNRLHLAMCIAHVPGFQVIDDTLPKLLDPKQGAGNVAPLFSGRKNKRRSERWKKVFVNFTLAYLATAETAGKKCTDEDACGWFVDYFEDENLKRSGKTEYRQQRVRTLCNILSAERRKLRTHKVGPRFSEEPTFTN